MTYDKCPMCGRDLIPNTGSINDHHLIPRLKGGKNGPKVTLHKVCHGFIHATFTEGELARKYNTIEILLQQEPIQKFAAWVAKKPPEFVDSNRDTNTRKRKRGR